MYKQQKGITLIALVITIIVMLVLVAVTISMAVNGGLFSKAGEAVGKTNNALTAEQDLSNGEVTIGNTYYNSIDEYLGTSGDTLPAYVDANKENGYLTEKATYSDGVEEKPAIIPAGYKIVNEGEKIANGIVIADSNGNEFVWIPVEKAIVTETEIAKIKEDNTDITTDLAAVQKMVTDGTFPMAVQVGENYKGILYDFSGTTNLTATVYDWTSTSSYREPAVLSDYYDKQATFTTYGLGEYSDDLYQKAYNSMVESVADNGGFYVGRYEISSGTYTLADGSTVTYAQSKSDQTALASTQWYNMYKYERDYAKYNTNLGVISEMIWGSQWDQMMIFVNGKDDGRTTPKPFYVTTYDSRYKETSSTSLTGKNTADQVANIFDLEAGRMEWTQEARSKDNRLHRGGYRSRVCIRCCSTLL